MYSEITHDALIGGMDLLLEWARQTHPMFHRQLLRIWRIMLHLTGDAKIARALFAAARENFRYAKGRGLPLDCGVEDADAFFKSCCDVALQFAGCAGSEAGVRIAGYLKKQFRLLDKDSLKLHMQADLGLKALDVSDVEFFPDAQQRMSVAIAETGKLGFIEDFRLEGPSAIPQERIEYSICGYYGGRGFELVKNKGCGFMHFRSPASGEKNLVSYTNTERFLIVSVMLYPF
jgi:hypothetical protein